MVLWSIQIGYAKRVQRVPKIVIRPAREADAHAMLTYLRQLADEQNPFLLITSDHAYDMTIDDERKFIRKHRKVANSLLLIAMDGDKVVGAINATGEKRVSTQHTVTLGVSVLDDWRDKGVGTRLLQHCLAWAKRNTKIKRVQLDVFVGNERAIHVYEKLGFCREGLREAYYYKNGQFIDAIIMAIVFD